MELITRGSLAKSCADRYKEKYHRGGNDWFNQINTDSRKVYFQILKLGLSPTPEQIKEIIGRDWCRVTCDECEKTVDAVMQLGQPPDYESKTACVCLDCLQKAVSVITTEPTP